MRPPSPEPRAGDLAFCREVIRRHSKSFHLASRLLPGGVRDAAVATYAFCRGADDDVDAAGPASAARARHRATRERLARIYAGGEMDDPVGRCFAAVVRRHGIPRAEPEALLDGMEQDLGEVRIADEAALLLYADRAAGVVGRMMSRIMGRADEEALRRATDLGIAMQLTNIARDVGEDAARGRVYLPGTWLDDAGASVADVLSGAPREGVLTTNRRVLDRAEQHYESGIAGIGLLPFSCRPAILAAALFYREIGRRVAARGGDGVTARVRVGGGRKLALLVQVGVRCLVDPRLHARRTEAGVRADGTSARVGVPR